MFKAADKWLLPYLIRPRPPIPENGYLLICICDHFEPLHATDKAGALERTGFWNERLPQLSAEFEETMGSPLRWSFFYPIEQYDADIVEDIAKLCRKGCGEVEVHLHHDNDSDEHMAEALAEGKNKFREHGLLGSDSDGTAQFGFVHGNWALCNSRADGRRCGVSNELKVLLDAGCYADFTMPAVPDPCQTRIVNSIYYAAPTSRPRAADTGTPAKVGVAPPSDKLLMVQGPLGLNWSRRKFGVLPRIDNADLTRANPPTKERLTIWRNQCVHVEGRTEWSIVKLHTHGAYPENNQTLLGRQMTEFGREIAIFQKQHAGWKVLFVTSRELANIVHAAEAGKTGNPLEFRDFAVSPPPLGSVKEEAVP